METATTKQILIWIFETSRINHLENDGTTINHLGSDGATLMHPMVDFLGANNNCRILSATAGLSAANSCPAAPSALIPPGHHHLVSIEVFLALE